MKLSILIVILCAWTIMAEEEENWGKCRALVLEGGGDRGAYQAGAIRGLYEKLGKEAKYDVLSGVSAGAVNAVAYSFFDIGQEEEATNFLIDFWTGMRRNKCYVNWQFSYLEGLFFRKGIVNDTVFLEYLDETLPKREKINRRVTVGTTDARTGDFIRYTEAVGAYDLAYRAGRASTSIPGFFEAVQYDNRTLVDGGVVINLDIGGAISRCKEKGVADKNIIVDIVMCTGKLLKDVDPSEFTAIQMLYRYYQITQFQKSMIWISQGLAHFPDVHFRYIVYPKESYDKEWVPIGFDPKNLAHMVEVGKQHAKDAVEAGEGFNLRELTGSWLGSSNNPFNVAYMNPEQPSYVEDTMKQAFAN